ncbi:MAG: HEAT repeat domain-containing protein, partial [Myxococcota bacterium]
RRTRLRNRINQNVARALASLKAKEAVPDLVKLLEAPEPNTRDAVLRSLGTIGDPSAADVMMEIAENDDEPFIRKVAIESLGELGAAKAVPTLVKMLYSERGDGVSHYREARFALIQHGSAAVPELLKTLQRKNDAIETMKVGDAPILPGVIEAKAGSALGALRVNDAEQPMVSALQGLYTQWQRQKNAAEPSVLGAVIELTYALGDLGSPGARKAVLGVVSDTNPGIRLAATEALTTIGDSEAVPALLQAARSGGLDAKRAAVIAASQLGDGSRLDSFDALGTGELEPIVKAERARLEAAKECSSDIGCWQKKLTEENARVAARAAFQLGRLGAKDSARALLDAAEHDNPQVRMAAVLSLEELGAVDVARFEAILEDSMKRVKYAPVNQQMERIIALRSGSKS